MWIEFVINTGVFLLRSGAWSKSLLEFALRPEYDFGADDWGAPRGEQGNINVLLYGVPNWMQKAAIEDFDNGFHCPLCVWPKDQRKCLVWHTLRHWGYDDKSRNPRCTQQRAFRLAMEGNVAGARRVCCKHKGGFR